MDPSALTERQVEVLRLLERGLTNGEIAERLGITLDGAKFHVSEILARLEVATREEAVEAWRQRSRRPAGWLPLGAVGRSAVAWLGGATLAVAAVGITLAMVWGGGDGDDRVTAELALSGSVEPSSAARTPESPKGLLFSCPDVPPAVHDPRSIVDWVPFVQFNGTMYLPTGEPAKPLRESPVGIVRRNVSDTNVKPGQFVDCDSTTVPEATIFYAVEGFAPRFRIATSEGYLFQARSSKVATSGADLFDFEDKVVRVDVTWQGETTTTGGAIVDPATLRRIESALLAAPYDSRGNTPSDGYGITLTFLDGTRWGAGLSSKTGYVDFGLLLPADIVTLLVAVAPPAE